ncbi:MAG: TonB-dependent receptor [Candidatus Eremiobacteraeota bacterium]|nr:TonB-dependent receptor [Candidatus Eremiobacteraeota bacterium]
MKQERTLRFARAAALLIGLFLFQETWTLAGVTGNIAGTVRDNAGAPVAAAQVQAVSPSQSATAVTDDQGHFLFLALAPDTYTINVAKPGYQSTAFPGNTVFADQTQHLAFVLPKSLKTIARVTSQAGAALVKSGVGGDIYNVNSTQAAAAAPLGGGGSLNSAYSAIASVPGVLVGIGQMGWMQPTFIRGQNTYFTGFEYDGIPVNRAFDNYNTSTESSLGLQELQVYTGGGPASISTSGTSGFINQVIKTGTFPGFGNFHGSLATPTFYHQAAVEAGGSTPDRTFSYYVGLSGYNQAFRLLDNSNGTSLLDAPGPEALYSGGGPQGFGVTALCNPVTGAPPSAYATMSWGNGGCFVGLSGIAGFPGYITDRENIVNFHFGIPRGNGLRDDVQALWSSSALGTYGYDTPSQFGIYPYTLINTGSPYCPNKGGCTGGIYGANAYPYNPGVPWLDSVVYNKPFGTAVATNPGQTSPAINYFFPSSDTNRAPNAPAPFNAGTTLNNDTGIAKLQYTHALSSTAYLRAFAYSFYSDWLINSPEALAFFQGAYDYELDTHTVGGELQFSDQISDKNLLTFTGNYTTANVMRFNNSTIATASPIGYFSGLGASMTCYDPGAPSSSNPGGGKPVPCSPSSYWDTSAGGVVHPTWVSNAAAGPTGFSGPSNATWNTLWSGDVNGSLNTIHPKFASLSLTDQFRPSDHLLFEGGIRFDNYLYALPDSSTPATQYYANVMAKFTCYNVLTHQLLTEPILPSLAPPIPPPPFYVNGDCNTAVNQSEQTTGAKGWVHPNGKTQDGFAAPLFTANSPGSYGLTYWSPRISGTYTISPDTVLRASAGRFVQPPLSASVQYLSASGDDRSVWASSMNLGFFSPFHPIPGISSGQYDMSLEHHIRGTDWSFKLSPFFTDISNWQTQVFIGRGFVTQIPYGQAHNLGAELAVTKGDFTRNGWSGQASVTYTNAVVQFEGLGGAPNQISVLNNAVDYFNALTKAGGGSPCYTPASPTTGTFGRGTTNCRPGSGNILNPYYHMQPQPLENAAGWYPAPNIGIGPSLNYGPNFYQAPWVSSLILNYRHNALAITPSVQFDTGTHYGEPMDIIGLDPRSCAANSLTSKVPGAGISFPATQCNYTTAIAPGATPYGYLYIPNPQTGRFASYGQYTSPNILVANLSATYDISPKVRLQATATNLFHTCFGGSSEPWTTAYPAGRNVCYYVPQGNNLDNLYVSNFYNGTGPLDKKANGITPQPWQLQSYGPANGLFNTIPPPLNFYLGAEVKL